MVGIRLKDHQPGIKVQDPKQLYPFVMGCKLCGSLLWKEHSTQSYHMISPSYELCEYCKQYPLIKKSDDILKLISMLVKNAY